MTAGPNGMHQVRHFVRMVSSILLIGFGAMMLLGGGLNRLEKPQENPWSSTVLLMLILGAVPLGIGLTLFLRTRQQAVKSQAEAMERTVLQLARDAGGELTAAEVAACSALSVEDAQQILNDLNLRGVNVMDVSDVGVIVYRFPGLMTDDEQES